MKPSHRWITALATFVLAAGARSWALADAEATAGRLIVRRYAEAVVAVKLSVNMKVRLREREMPANEEKIDVNGTVISPDGMTITSLSAIDQNALFEALRTQMGQAGMGMELAQSETKLIRLQLADGTEIPAKIVWKDADHDLVFLLPDTSKPGPRRTFVYVDLNEAPESASMLGNYYHLSRMNETMQRAPVMRPSTVTGIIERPRRVLLISTDWHGDVLGTPVFDAPGHVLGICLRYVVNGAAKGTVVVPSADIVAIISQITRL